jgi:hypothetical protein
MRTCIHFAIFAGGIGMVLADVPPAQHSRIGPADIYPDPVSTPGAAAARAANRKLLNIATDMREIGSNLRAPSGGSSLQERFGGLANICATTISVAKDFLIVEFGAALRKKHPLCDLRRFSCCNLFQPVFMVQTSKDGAGDNSLTTRNSVT